MRKAADVGTEVETDLSAWLRQRQVNVVTGGCPRRGVGSLDDRRAPPTLVFTEQSYGPNY